MSTIILFGGGVIPAVPSITSASLASDVKCKPGNSWKIVTPQETTNYVLNPSAEVINNYSANGSSLITRDSSYQKYGLYSYLIQTAVASDGITLNLTTLPLAPFFLTVRIRGDVPTLTAELSGGATATLKFIEKIDKEWILMGCSFVDELAVGSTSLTIGTLTAGLFDIWMDGIQLEPLPYWTTYCDGTQEGCLWSSTPHASISTRSADIRAGGQVVDLFDTYKFFVKHVVGAGVAPIDVSIDSYAILPGGELNNIKTQSRDFTLVGEFHADNEPELHRNRQALHSVLDNDTLPGDQPIKIIFSGADVQKEIKVHYKGGLEGDLAAFYQNFQADDSSWTRLLKFTEKASIQLTAPDPFWYEVGESAAVLAVNTAQTFKLVAKRAKDTGLWDNLGPVSSYSITDAGGVYAIAEDDTYQYFGGDFINWDGIADADFIVRRNKATGAYSAMSTGMNGIVRDILVSVTGLVYVVGDFTLAGGVTDTVHIAYWDYGDNDWHPLGTGLNGNTNGLAEGPLGEIYAVGDFTSASGVANTTGIAYYLGGTWFELGGGLDSGAKDIAISKVDGGIYIVGGFTLAGGDAMDNFVARYIDGAWDNIGAAGGLGYSGQCVDVDPITGIVYYGGLNLDAFTVALVAFKGNMFTTLAIGISVYTVAAAPDGMVYFGGFFSSLGTVPLTQKAARYNGYTYAPIGLDLPGDPIVYKIYVGKHPNPGNKSYDLYLGFDTEGAGQASSNATVVNTGSSPAFPKLIFANGADGSTIETIKNERVGNELMSTYALLANEVLTLDLKPDRKSSISSYFGARLNAVLSSSNFGAWSLYPGSNLISSFVLLTGDAPLVYLLWRDTYKSYD